MGMLVLALVALLLCGWWISQPWRLAWRRARIARRPFPAAWRAILRRRVPLVQRLPVDLQLRLKGLIQVFLAEKSIVGCAGLTVTDEVRVTIAAQACLPLLGRPRGFYPELSSVLVYPGAFVVDRLQQDGLLQRHDRRVLTGESWSRGQVVLSWDHVREEAGQPDGGSNVVVHEFAHQLDQAGGAANGAPWLPGAWWRRRWSQVWNQAYAQASARRAQGDEGELMGDYALSAPAEFFAVASERFFGASTELARQYPALHAELRRYYGVDPRLWQA